MWGEKKKKGLIPDGLVLNSKITEFSRRFADHLQDGVIQAILSTGRDHLIHPGQHVCVILGQAVSHHASRELFRFQLDVRDGAAEGVGEDFGNLGSKKKNRSLARRDTIPPLRRWDSSGLTSSYDNNSGPRITGSVLSGSLSVRA
jgi:hypothetical protein